MKTSWPKLEYTEWIGTYETLHRWLQIVGKLRLCKSPWANHSWNTTLYVSARGLTTLAIPIGELCLTVEFDFIDHKLTIEDSVGRKEEMKLRSQSVAGFYSEFMQKLKIFNIEPTFNPTPNELPEAVAFAKDETHRTYVPEQANNCFQVLVRAHNVLQDFRTLFVGKSSPVHFFWGSFDLALTRFSGRRAPEHPGGIPHLPDYITRESYSHEVMSVGFWPGNGVFPHAAFYAYAYPEPRSFSKAWIIPHEAFYHPEMHEFILPYDEVRNSSNPEATLKKFFDSTYRAAANLGSWDRDILENSPYLSRLREQTHFNDISEGRSL